MPKIAALQMTSSDQVAHNLATAERLLKAAAEQEAVLAVLPENFALMRKHSDEVLAIKENFGTGPLQSFLAEQARRHKLWIVGGTLPIAAEDSNKVYAACLLYNSEGLCVARYNKIHLFDVTVGTEEHFESKLISQGSQTTLAETPFGKLGLAVCYDVRFPELFRHYFAQGAELFALPTAFTVPTGQAHWEVLTRARAIENFCYLIAACQSGAHTNGRKTYGHSMIINPWGEILACLPEGEGVITAEVDLTYSHELQKKMPISKHRRL